MCWRVNRERGIGDGVRRCAAYKRLDSSNQRPTRGHFEQLEVIAHCEGFGGRAAECRSLGRPVRLPGESGDDPVRGRYRDRYARRRGWQNQPPIHVITRALEPQGEVVHVALLERHVAQVRRLVLQAVVEGLGVTAGPGVTNTLRRFFKAVKAGLGLPSHLSKPYCPVPSSTSW